MCDWMPVELGKGGIQLTNKQLLKHSHAHRLQLHTTQPKVQNQRHLASETGSSVRCRPFRTFMYRKYQLIMEGRCNIHIGEEGEKQTNPLHFVKLDMTAHYVSDMF